jgi:hypothetical protein
MDPHIVPCSEATEFEREHWAARASEMVMSWRWVACFSLGFFFLFEGFESEDEAEDEDGDRWSGYVWTSKELDSWYEGRNGPLRLKRRWNDGGVEIILEVWWGWVYFDFRSRKRWSRG